MFKLVIVLVSFTSIPFPGSLAALTFAASNVPEPSSLSKPAGLFKTIPEAFVGKATVPLPSIVN